MGTIFGVFTARSKSNGKKAKVYPSSTFYIEEFDERLRLDRDKLTAEKSKININNK